MFIRPFYRDKVNAALSFLSVAFTRADAYLIDILAYDYGSNLFNIHFCQIVPPKAVE